MTLARFTLATAEQLHQLHGGQAGLKQTQKRMSRLHAEGLAEFVTLPQAGRTKAWHLTAAGAAVSATFPEARRPGHPAVAEQAALRYGRGHLLDRGGCSSVSSGFWPRLCDQ
ncbi:replication-relaxation family protein [Kitasatospora sp. NPDC056651]|uniref:replication-relaxation family protein n=1 Tax=Kitasatospora sp. NPDC056651 TaxID=3345892 RepID=UPI0036C0B269